MKIFTRFLPLVFVAFFVFTQALSKAPSTRSFIVCEQSITLSTQAEVDAFTCTAIGGDLTITGSDITNLESLYSLTSIDGSLFITGNAQLITIGGLRGLTSVGEMVYIVNNTQLINLDGLSSLVAVSVMFPFFMSIEIVGNPALISIQGLGSLKTTPGSWRIENNGSLPNLDGLELLTQIGSDNMRIIGLTIKGNAALTNIDGLSALQSVVAYYSGTVVIEDNPTLSNLNGLSSLTTISGGPYGGLIIQRNASLTNVDGLSSLISIAGVEGFLIIQDNPNLTNGCGLYPILHNRELTGFPVNVTISGNGAGFTEEEILSVGPCPESTIVDQPSQLLITEATDRSMKIAFTPAVLIPTGYITLLQAYGSPFPDDAPVDGTAYHIGNSIGSSTVVVGVGPDTTVTVTSLIPNTIYYFAIFAYYEGHDYVRLNPLEGQQSTTHETTPLHPDPAVQASTLVFSAICSTSMVLSFTPPTAIVPDGYITFMRAFTAPSPEDVPVSGANYYLGDVIGHSTVVVGLGPSISLNIESLIPEMEYFYDVYTYHRPNEGSPIFIISSNPLSGSASTTFSNFNATAHRSTPYPNPFVEEITIPFTVITENTMVQIVIFDPMGRKIAELTSQRFNAGYHEVIWDRTDYHGSKVTHGLYKYSVISSESKQGRYGTLVAR